MVNDLVHETFVCAYHAWHRFDGRSSVRTWLHGIAVNVVRNYRAKQRRRIRNRRMFDRMRGAATPGSEQARLEARDTLKHLYRALDQLDDRLREAFILHRVQKQPLSMVAAILNVPVSTVHGRVERATRELRKRLEIV